MSDSNSLLPAVDPAEAATILPWFDDLLDYMNQSEKRFARWADILPQQLQHVLVSREHGDQERWLQALTSLPIPPGVQCDLQADDLAIHADISADTTARVEQALRGLMPWRKGPFQVCGTHIDTEWRSDWKWQRVLPHLSPLQNRLVLDVGCGSGYHMWRMLGEGARRVIGVDPSRLFLMQFEAIKNMVTAALGKRPAAHLLPLKMEDIPADLRVFDTLFSMGVLYHRRSPIEHLEELRAALRPGGELVLETLVAEGPLGYSLMPEDRYAMMRNVWFIPSPETLLLWCRRAGLRNARLVNLNQTSLDEQRSTDWMRYKSLPDFLDPANRELTAEGYPAPLRAIVIAEA